MKKICFVLNVSSGINYGSVSAFPLIKNNGDLKKYFSKYYDVSIDYIKDKDVVDFLVVPKPFAPFENENNLPIIEVPTILFMKKDYKEIKSYVDAYFNNEHQK
ncbi:hypothetical protein [Enterococcus dongliensis]|uniref:hypothetical protein n=1 Tax=Enterococcus dongliensis TaxID=2559925 RepID=UPI002891D627|nr:hypothetical protein [Enterococcus dongliensis]MDT2614606.1 hypothetical protein [Enterococcus dongliensis]